MCKISKEDWKAARAMLLYMVFAVVIVFISVLIGPGIFKLANLFSSLGILSSFLPVYNITDYSVSASDAASYYLQALLAVVVGFLTIKYSK